MPAGDKLIGFDTYAVIHHMVGDNAISAISLWVGKSFVGRINFYPSGSNIPNSQYTSYGTFMLNCENDKYPGIIDTIRYEKPVYVSIKWDDKNIITLADILTTIGEPVGEQEGQGAPFSPT